MRRLGLVLDQIIHTHAGRYSTDEVVIRFVEELAAREFDRIRFCSRVRPAGDDAPYPLDPARFEVVPLPWYTSVPALCARAPVLLPRVGRVFARELPDWQLAMAGGIHPLTPLLLRMAKRRGVPSLLWIRGDLMTDLRYRLRGPARAAGLAIARLVLAAIPAGTPVLSVGRDDYPFLRRMGPVTTEQRQAIEALTTGIINKVAHYPIIRLKESASSSAHSEGETIRQTIRKIFGLR